MSEFAPLLEGFLAPAGAKTQTDRIDKAFLEDELPGISELMEDADDSTPDPAVGRVIGINEKKADHVKVRDAMIEVFGSLDGQDTERAVLVAQPLVAEHVEAEGVSYGYWRIGFSMETMPIQHLRRFAESFGQAAKVKLAEKLKARGLEMREAGSSPASQMIQAANRVSVPVLYFDCLISR